MRKTAAWSARWTIVFGTAWLVTMLFSFSITPDGPVVDLAGILVGAAAGLLLGALILRR